MLRDIRGKRALVTGGSSGIGKAIAAAWLARGGHVCVTARDEARLLAAADELRRAAPADARVIAHRLDATDAAAVERAAPVLLQELGGLDLLVNNAGASHAGEAIDTPLSVYRRLMDVNYFGTVHTTHAFLQHFRGQRSGHIAAVASVAGFLGVYGFAAYAPTKHAVVGFMECLRQELVPFGVGTSVLYPGDTDTPMLQAENASKPEATRAISGNVPVMQPAEVARAFLDGVAGGAVHIVPGMHARLTHLAHRFAPSLVRFVIDRDVRRTRPRS